MKTKVLFLTFSLFASLVSTAVGQTANCSAASMLPSGGTDSCNVPPNQIPTGGETFPTSSSRTFDDVCWNAQQVVTFNQLSTTNAGGQCTYVPPMANCYGQFDHQITFAATGSGYNGLYNRGYDVVSFGGCQRNGGFHQDFRQCLASACPSGGCNSPIAISVGGEEIINNISSSEDGVPYDLKGDGHPLWYAWQKHGDHNIGWLALTDQNGGVPNGKYLFGNYTPNEDCPNPNQNNGWKALAEYTEKDNGGNGDKYITPADAVYRKLRVWVDKNHDGVAQPNELFTLPQVGIMSIGTDYEETKIADEYGNWYRYKGQINPLGRPPGSRVNPVAYDVYLRSRQIVYSSTGSTATLASAASSIGASSTGNASPGPINGLCCNTCGIAPK